MGDRSGKVRLKRRVYALDEESAPSTLPVYKK